ncbi:PA14 domain-containing protein [Flammeovirga sp. SJP92]|uniref:PA14 domain-containing protein n=1 Tax=Flammeovirga sp. SJP92 TaxID=1775430 RepID=UPI000787253D|nr:PA14 domain-containing protein [Flammeovirga sp. SJP92]KXX71294.1 hypothetical protein AVL50_09575 [Flammeovirga sp. SJP92]
MKLLLITTLLVLGVFNLYGKDFIHPGLSHKKSDLERMKSQVLAGIEPWKSSYADLTQKTDASFNYNVQGPTQNGNEAHYFDESSLGPIQKDGQAAYYNALMWYVTEDIRYAEKAIEIFEAWSTIRYVKTIPLTSGKALWRMLEAAEIIKHTYGDWEEESIQSFKEMLVYPGWSGTQVPDGDKSFYWTIYNGDKARHGNQGLFAFRSVMAMGIFMDNETIYNRALRHLQGLPHDENDLPYPSGPPITQLVDTGNEYYEEYKIVGYEDTIEDYIYNGSIENYIWENGQSQESARDQAHAFGGISIIATMCEMAWNQGDDIYGFSDNRLLLGLEFAYRYNISYNYSFPDQEEPWEPTVASGEFIERTDRSGRWKSLKINPWTAHLIHDEEYLTRGKHDQIPLPQLILGHYKDRLHLDQEKYKWVNRADSLALEARGGYENAGTYTDHPSFGHLFYHRIKGAEGDPVQSFTNQVPTFGMHTLPTTIEAVNFDHFVLDGNDKTYFDLSDTNEGGEYRLDQSVDIEECSEGGYNLTGLESGEWLNYTIAVPVAGLYTIKVRYASESTDGKLKFSFDGEDKTEEITVPFGGEDSQGMTDWKELVVASDIILKEGVQIMKVNISGVSNSFTLKNISLEEGTPSDCEEAWSGIKASDNFQEGVYYQYFEGDWEELPNLDNLEAKEEGFTDNIHLDIAQKSSGYALQFDGYINMDLKGSYTFYTTSDEALNLWIDGEKVIEYDGSQSNNEQQATVCLDKDYHSFKIQYFNQSDDAELSVMYEGPGIKKGALTSLFATVPCENSGIVPPEDLLKGQINYTYYEGTWSEIPDFKTYSAKSIGIHSSVDLNIEGIQTSFGLVFNGYINIAKGGEYTFYTASDDGSRLSVDDVEVVDNDGLHPSQERSGVICLAPGYHSVSIEYFNVGSSKNLSASVEGLGQPKVLLSEFGLYGVPVPDKQAQTITFPEFDEPKLITDEDFDPGATASSFLKVNYNTSDREILYFIGGKMKIVGAGTVDIIASQAGDARFLPAESITRTLVISKLTPIITFPEIETKTLDSKDFDPGATINIEDLELTYSSSDDAVVEYIYGKLRVRGIGEAEVTVSNIETDQYKSVSATQKVVVVQDNVTSIDSNPKTIEIYPNPVIDFMKVINKSNNQNVELEIINSASSLVSTSKLNKVENTIDLRKLQKGVYIIRVRSDNTVLSNEKIIKK